MKRSLKQKLLLGAAALAVLAGGTMAAVTAARQAPHRTPHGPVAVAAGYLGLSTAQLQSELHSGRSLAQIANATGGKSASGLANALIAADRARLSTAIATLPSRVQAQVNRAGGPNGRTLGAAAPRRQGGAAAARYLGISRAQLQRELRSGRSLAEIADTTPGKSAAGLIDALVSARKAALDARVADGRLTRAHEQARLSKLHAKVSTVVNQARPRG
jgi:hypothetical protein